MWICYLAELTWVFCYKASCSVSSYIGPTDVDFITFYLIVEVTTFSQSVYVEEALPHTSSQAGRNAHPNKTLNLKNKKNHAHATTNIFPFLKRFYKTHLTLADETASIPVAEQLTKLFNSGCAQLRVTNNKTRLRFINLGIRSLSAAETVINVE